MHIFNKTGLAFGLLLCTLATNGQTNGSNSSYSRFGLGSMNDQSQGFNRGMSGVAQGMRSGQKINLQNPASYSAIDSLTFIFDVGMGMQYGHFKQGGNSNNARNTSLEYVNAGCHIAKGLGLSFGFLPYSTIGYNFTTQNRVGSNWTSSQTITTQTTYYGNGGLHQMYLGLGWNPFAKLSIGVNASYIWGDYNHSLAEQYYEGSTSNSSYNSLNREWTSDVKTYKIDLGAQYPIRMTHQDWLTLGATVSLGHSIKSEVELLEYGSISDSIQCTKKNVLDMPYTFSAGAAWQHQGRIIIAADYSMEKWSGCRVPVSQSTDKTVDIVVKEDQYINRHKVNVGAEYIQKPQSRKYSERVRYRIGASYSTPYVKVNGVDGPKEYGITAGVGLPLTNNSKSLINVNLQWLKRAPATSSMITENYIMLHVGITFNEMWFMKFKIK